MKSSSSGFTDYQKSFPELIVTREGVQVWLGDHKIFTTNSFFMVRGTVRVKLREASYWVIEPGPRNFFTVRPKKLFFPTRGESIVPGISHHFRFACGFHLLGLASSPWQLNIRYSISPCLHIRASKEVHSLARQALLPVLIPPVTPSPSFVTRWGFLSSASHGYVPRSRRGH